MHNTKRVELSAHKYSCSSGSPMSDFQFNWTLTCVNVFRFWSLILRGQSIAPHAN